MSFGISFKPTATATVNTSLAWLQQSKENK